MPVPRPRTRPQPRLRRLAVAATLSLCLVSASGTVGGAVTRDVEVTDADATDGALRLFPAASLLGGGDIVQWPATITNAGSVPVDLELAVTAATLRDGRLTPGDEGVAWAVLPRRTVHLGPGQQATLGIELRPPSGAPTALALTASVADEPDRRAMASAVVGADARSPDVAARIDGDQLVLASSVTTIVDVAVATKPGIGPTSTSRVGPLLLLAGQDRTLPIGSTDGLFGGSVEVVVAVDGVEVARKTAGGGANLVALVSGTLAVVLLAGAGGWLLWSRRRPTPIPMG